MSAALPASPLVEYRTYFGVEVGIAHAAPTEGAAGTSWIIFPDGKYRIVRAQAYANFDDACAAEVAVWRKRRIRLGLDKPTAQAAPEMDLLEEVREEFHSERVVIECGEKGQQFGAKCLRQLGHENSGSKRAEFHYGRVTESGPGFKFVDDGEEYWELWRKVAEPKVLH